MRTSFNQQGFPTTVTINMATATEPKSYDQSGFEITPTLPPPAGPTSGNAGGASGPSSNAPTTLQKSVTGLSESATDVLAAAASTQASTSQATNSAGQAFDHIVGSMLALLVLASTMLML